MIKENQMYKLKGTNELFVVEGIEFFESEGNKGGSFEMVELFDIANEVKSTIEKVMLDKLFELVELKEGNRIYITRFGGKKIELFGTLTEVEYDTAKITDCNIPSYDDSIVYLPNNALFGKNETDYFYFTQTVKHNEPDAYAFNEPDAYAFKVGVRVHVKRLNGDDVDFYATLGEAERFKDTLFILTERTDGRTEKTIVYAHSGMKFGKQKQDYYTLATDEPEPIKSEIEYTNAIYNKTYYEKLNKAARASDSEFEDRIHALKEDDEETDVHDVISGQAEEDDMVNEPSHYSLGEYEVKDIVALVANKYHKGSVAHDIASALEYQMRAPEKNGLEDIKKARKRLDYAIENWEG